MEHVRRLYSGLVGTLLAAALICGASARAGTVTDRPLQLSETAGLFALAFRSEATVQAPTPKGRKKTIAAFKKWFAGELGGSVRSTLPNSRGSRNAQKLINRAYGRLLDQQVTHADAARSTATKPALNALGIASVVTSVGLTADEGYTLALTHEDVSYSATLDQTKTYASGSGGTLLVNYTAPPAQGTTSPYLFAALVREQSAPSLGVLVVVVFDSALPAVLEDEGALNADLSGSELSIPFGLTLTGSSSGVHEAEGALVFDAFYYARQNVAGVGVPPELAAQAQALVSKLKGEQ